MIVGPAACRVFDACIETDLLPLNNVTIVKFVWVDTVSTISTVYSPRHKLCLGLDTVDIRFYFKSLDSQCGTIPCYPQNIYGLDNCQDEKKIKVLADHFYQSNYTHRQRRD